MTRVGDESLSSEFLLGFCLMISALHIDDTAKDKRDNKATVNKEQETRTCH